MTPLKSLVPFPAAPLLLALVASVGCNDKPTKASDAALNSPAPPTPTPAPTPSQVPEPPRAWFEGRWRGTAPIQSVTAPAAADALVRAGEPVPAPSAEVRSEPLTLDLDADGAARGTLAGLEISGRLDGDVVRADLRSTTQAGVLLATRTSSGLSVVARFSDGDSKAAFVTQLLLTLEAPK